jgi:hypothetical protein
MRLRDGSLRRCRGPSGALPAARSLRVRSRRRACGGRATGVPWSAGPARAAPPSRRRDRAGGTNTLFHADPALPGVACTSTDMKRRGATSGADRPARYSPGGRRPRKSAFLRMRATARRRCHTPPSSARAGVRTICTYHYESCVIMIRGIARLLAKSFGALVLLSAIIFIIVAFNERETASVLANSLWATLQGGRNIEAAAYPFALMVLARILAGVLGQGA